MKRKIVFVLVLLSLPLFSCRRLDRDNDHNDQQNAEEWDPRNVSRSPGLSYAPSIAIDNEGNVHLVWSDDTPGNYEVFYSFKKPDSDWVEPIDISNTSNNSYEPSMDIDPFDNLHVVWEEEGVGIFYSMKPKDGDWTDPVKIPAGGSWQQPRLGVDAQGTIHVITSTPFTLRYMCKIGGIWSEPEYVPSPGHSGDNPAMVVEPSGIVHTIGETYAWPPNNIYYTVRSLDGSWSEPFNVSASQAYSWSADIAIDDENVYIAWKEVRTGVDQIFYRIRHKDGTWTAIDSVPDIIGKGTGMVTIVAKNGDLHFLWGASVYKDTMFTVLRLDDIYYKVRLRDGEWTPTLNISNTGSAVVPVAIIDANGNLHVAWSDESPGNYDIYYTVINLSSGIVQKY